MIGIDLNQPIIYKHSSMRFFSKNECHITRYCKTDVLLLVFEGTLRFTEDGNSYELHSGDYHIQKAGSYQTGKYPSDGPKYLYVHFTGHWSESEHCLQKQGRFNYHELRSLMEKLDMASHNDLTLTEKIAIFYQILSVIYRPKGNITTANKIAAYIGENFDKKISLDILCEKFHFSKNHIINIFKSEYNLTPFEYLNNIRMKKAEYLMEVTSMTVENISYICGFSDYSYFYKLFKKTHNSSPVEWRKTKREQLNNTVSTNRA